METNNTIEANWLFASSQRDWPVPLRDAYPKTLVLRRACRALWGDYSICAQSDSERAQMIRATEEWVARHPEAFAPCRNKVREERTLNRVGSWKARKGYHRSDYCHCTVGAVI